MNLSPAVLSPAVRATAGLGVTQIIGWGTTFLMPSVLGRSMERTLGLPSEVIYGGITVMFGVGALFSPWVGKSMVLKRFHARARGRGAQILKPYSHLTIVVRENTGA